MADFTFLHVFGASLVVSALRHTLFNPMSLVSSLAGSSAGQKGTAAPQNPM